MMPACLGIIVFSLVHSSHSESSYQNAAVYGQGRPAVRSVSQRPMADDAVTRQRQDHIFVRDAVHGRLYGPYQGERLEAARNSGAEVVILNPIAIPVIEAARRGGRWYVRGPDGVLRGAFPAEAMRLWLEASQLPPNALAYAGNSLPTPVVRTATTGASSSSPGQDDPWKSTWLKHLRPHRWRATRKAVKFGKVAAKSSASAVASVAVRSWAEEEAEWAELVTKSHASRLPTPRPQAPSTTPYGPERRRQPPLSQSQHHQQQEESPVKKPTRGNSYRPPQPPPRAIDVRKQRTVTDAWRDDSLSQRSKRRIFFLTLTAVLAISCYALYATGLVFDIADQAESLFSPLADYMKNSLLPALYHFFVRLKSMLIALVQNLRGLGSAEELSDSTINILENDESLVKSLFATSATANSGDNKAAVSPLRQDSFLDFIRVSSSAPVCYLDEQPQ